MDPDAQWEYVEPFVPKPRVRADGRGRPWRDPCDVLNGVLWILKMGAPWADLPRRYPPYQMCHRRYQAWIRVRPATQDGRPLRRYRRRWKVERLNAWLQNSRRVLVRHDYYLENFRGFVQLACMLILLRHL